MHTTTITVPTEITVENHLAVGEYIVKPEPDASWSPLWRITGVHMADGTPTYGLEFRSLGEWRPTVAGAPVDQVGPGRPFLHVGGSSPRAQTVLTGGKTLTIEHRFQVGDKVVSPVSGPHEITGIGVYSGTEAPRYEFGPDNGVSVSRADRAWHLFEPPQHMDRYCIDVTHVHSGDAGRYTHLRGIADAIEGALKREAGQFTIQVQGETGMVELFCGDQT